MKTLGNHTNLDVKDELIKILSKHVTDKSKIFEPGNFVAALTAAINEINSQPMQVEIIEIKNQISESCDRQPKESKSFEQECLPKIDVKEFPSCEPENLEDQEKHIGICGDVKNIEQSKTNICGEETDEHEHEQIIKEPDPCNYSHGAGSAIDISENQSEAVVKNESPEHQLWTIKAICKKRVMQKRKMRHQKSQMMHRLW